MHSSIPVIDVFAGPGGLSEGFAAREEDFHILLSAEKEASAHRTLRLRSFLRLLRREGACTDSFYKYLNHGDCDPWSQKNEWLWKRAEHEALKLELGNENDDILLHDRLRQLELEGQDWVLIGGPPCQAYSVAGRVRNKGNKDYNAAEDSRHFLYREYLKIIQEFRPSVFVMENVQGILSSKVEGESMFENILQDLSDPDRATGRAASGAGYRIHSLVHDGVSVTSLSDTVGFDGRVFTVRCEKYGIPQARHRVILLGIREDLPEPHQVLKSFLGGPIPVHHAISDLPRLRSRVSRQADSHEKWTRIVANAAAELSESAGAKRMHFLAAELMRVEAVVKSDRATGVGAVRLPTSLNVSERRQLLAPHIAEWTLDDRLEVVLNHEARSHMESELSRLSWTGELSNWTSPKPIGNFQPQKEARSNASGLIPPRWL